jgi:hypothetical protein
MSSVSPFFSCLILAYISSPTSSKLLIAVSSHFIQSCHSRVLCLGTVTTDLGLHLVHKTLPTLAGAFEILLSTGLCIHMCQEMQQWWWHMATWVMAMCI